MINVNLVCLSAKLAGWKTLHLCNFFLIFWKVKLGWKEARTLSLSTQRVRGRNTPLLSDRQVKLCVCSRKRKAIPFSKLGIFASLPFLLKIVPHFSSADNNPFQVLIAVFILENPHVRRKQNYSSNILFMLSTCPQPCSARGSHSISEIVSKRSHFGGREQECN